MPSAQVPFSCSSKPAVPRILSYRWLPNPPRLPGILPARSQIIPSHNAECFFTPDETALLRHHLRLTTRWPSICPLFNKPLSLPGFFLSRAYYSGPRQPQSGLRGIYMLHSHIRERKIPCWGKKEHAPCRDNSCSSQRANRANNYRASAPNQPIIQPQRGVTEEKKMRSQLTRASNLSPRSIIKSFYRDVICWFPIRVPSGRCHSIRNRLLQEFTDWEYQPKQPYPDWKGIRPRAGSNKSRQQGRTDCTTFVPMRKKGFEAYKRHCLETWPVTDHLVWFMP